MLCARVCLFVLGGGVRCGSERARAVLLPRHTAQHTRRTQHTQHAAAAAAARTAEVVGQHVQLARVPDVGPRLADDGRLDGRDARRVHLLWFFLCGAREQGWRVAVRHARTATHPAQRRCARPHTCTTGIAWSTTASMMRLARNDASSDSDSSVCRPFLWLGWVFLCGRVRRGGVLAVGRARRRL